MKALAINVLCGPLLMVLTALLGIPCGYYLGFIPSCVLLPVVAIALGILLRRFTEDALPAMLAAACAILTGLASAHAMFIVRELETGAFARNVAIADLPRLLGKDRLTLADGHRRADLGEMITIRTKSGVGSDAHWSESTCHVYPVVPQGWRRDQPVSVWRYGDPVGSTSEKLSEEVFQPHLEPPADAACAQALARAISEHHLQQAARPIYLEVATGSPDSDDNKLGVWFGVALLSALWIGIALYAAARDAIVERWHHR